MSLPPAMAERLTVSRETMDRLTAYVALVEKKMKFVADNCVPGSSGASHHSSSVAAGQGQQILKHDSSAHGIVEQWMFRKGLTAGSAQMYHLGEKVEDDEDAGWDYESSSEEGEEKEQIEQQMMVDREEEGRSDEKIK